MDNAKNGMFYFDGDEPVLGRKGIIIGLIYLPFYLFIYPNLLSLLAGFLESRYSITMSPVSANLIYYGVMLASVFIMYGRFLAASALALKKQLSVHWLYTPIVALICIYICNFITRVICLLSLGNMDSANNAAAIKMIDSAPLQMLVMTAICAPIVEEVFFRALLFRPLSRKCPVLAYIVTAITFGLIHVLQQVAASGDFSELIYIIQYIPSGLFLAASYHYLKNIYASILVHAMMNGISVVLIVVLKTLRIGA